MTLYVRNFVTVLSVSGRLLEIVRRVSGGCMDGIWKVSGGCRVYEWYIWDVWMVDAPMYKNQVDAIFNPRPDHQYQYSSPFFSIKNLKLIFHYILELPEAFTTRIHKKNVQKPSKKAKNTATKVLLFPPPSSSRKFAGWVDGGSRCIWGASQDWSSQDRSSQDHSILARSSHYRSSHIG